MHSSYSRKQILVDYFKVGHLAKSVPWEEVQLSNTAVSLYVNLGQTLPLDSIFWHVLTFCYLQFRTLK